MWTSSAFLLREMPTHSHIYPAHPSQNTKYKKIQKPCRPSSWRIVAVFILRPLWPSTPKRHRRGASLHRGPQPPHLTPSWNILRPTASLRPKQFSLGRHIPAKSHLVNYTPSHTVNYTSSPSIYRSLIPTITEQQLGEIWAAFFGLLRSVLHQTMPCRQSDIRYSERNGLIRIQLQFTLQ